MADDESGGESHPPQPNWIIYLGVLLAGLLMLADALHYAPALKISARLGVALVYSAVALFIGNGRPAGYIGTVILWVAVIITFLV